MSAREAIVANIRRSLGVTGAEVRRRFDVETRLARAPAGVVPKRSQGDAETRAASFMAEAARTAVTLAEVATLADIPDEVARFSRENNAPASLRVGADERLAAMPWSRTPLEILRGPSDGHDPNGLSVAFAAIAETGTVVLASGADNPTTLNFPPDNQVVVIRRDDILADYESVFLRLREAYGRAARHARSIS